MSSSLFLFFLWTLHSPDKQINKIKQSNNTRNHDDYKNHVNPDR